MTLTEYLVQNPKKYLIFDFDETIVWANVNWNKVQRLRYEYLKKLVPEVVLNDNGLSGNKRLGEIADRYGTKFYKRVMNHEAFIETSNYKGFDPNPEIISFIKNNAEKYTLYIWSSNTEKLITSVLEELDLVRYFKEIISKDKVAHLKPNHEGFLKLKSENEQLGDYLMIGNSDRSDGGAAKNSGIDFFLINYFA